MRLFIALRAVLARESAADLINAAAHDAIQRWYLPEATGELKKARSDRDRAFWSGIVRLFEEYSNPRSTKGRHFGNQSAKKLIGVARAYGLGEEDILDMTLQIIEDFYQKKWWKRLRVKDGPEGLVKFMTSLFGTNAKWRARDIATHQQRERTLAPTEDDEGIPTPTGLETVGEKELMKIITKAVRKRFKKPYQRGLFNAWMKSLQKYGSTLNMDKHVYLPVADKFGVSKKTLSYNILRMRKEIASVLNQIGYEGVPKRFLGSSEFDVVDSVTCSEFIRRLARWILAGTSCCLCLALRVPFL